MTLRASNAGGEPYSATYQALRHLFAAAQSSSVTNKHWRLHSCFTDDHHVMTQYVFEDGSRIRADSTGERDSGHRFPDHEFTFYSKEEAEADE